MDTESAAWVAALAGVGPDREPTMHRLHELLLRAALAEAYRRGPAHRIGGPELTDLANQAADDAMVALLGKLDTFRGDSRFTTWAYRFVALEVVNKLGRHFWRNPSVSFDADDRTEILSRRDGDPLADTQHRELVEALARAVREALTDHQRSLFVAVVLHGVPVDTMVARSGLRRGAIYKAVFDARRKIRAHLIAHGHLDQPTATGSEATADRLGRDRDAA